MRRAILVAVAVWMLGGLLGGLAVAAEPAVSKEVLEKHAKAVAAVVPQNWAVRIDADGLGIWVERKEAVFVMNLMPSQPMRMAEEPPLGRAPHWFWRVSPPRSESEMKTLRKAVEDRDKALEMLRDGMKDMVATVKPDVMTEGFVARTAEQRARLEAFVAVKRALPEPLVPELFAADAAFNVWGDDYFPPVADVDKAEVARVREKIAGLFSGKPLN